MDDSVYDNGMYAVYINCDYDGYYIINKLFRVTEAEERSLPTAMYKADALRDVMEKRNAGNI